MTPDMVGVGKNKEGAQFSCNPDRIDYIEASRDQLGHPKYKEVPLLGRDFDTRNYQDRGFAGEGLFCTVN